MSEYKSTHKDRNNVFNQTIEDSVLISKAQYDMMQYYIKKIEESNAYLTRKLEAAEPLLKDYKYADKTVRYSDGTISDHPYFGYWSAKKEIGYCGCSFCEHNKKHGKKYDMHIKELK